MTQDEFCKRLMKLPSMMVEDVEQFIVEVATAPPQDLDRSREGKLIEAIAYRLTDIKTMPAAKAYADLMLSLGYIAGLRANAQKSVG